MDRGRMTDIRLADVSEFQEDVDADAYIRAGHGAIICRVHNGYRADHALPGRVAYLRDRPFLALGWYQYLAADRDAAQQAREFAATIGTLRVNEFPILDHETGAGDQTGRAEAWLAVIDAWAGFPASLYSGRAFLNEQLGGPARWRGRPLWIADYPASRQPVPAREPPGATWWQYSDRAQFAGIAGGVDASVFHGTAVGLRRAVRPAPASGPRVDVGDVFVVTGRHGGREAFVTRSGAVWHRWQRPGHAWSDWHSLGAP
jgi:GH25 family lysozyme M1 (1,4-beta-N-acetylmuramidase)